MSELRISAAEASERTQTVVKNKESESKSAQQREDVRERCRWRGCACICWRSSSKLASDASVWFRLERPEAERLRVQRAGRLAWEVRGGGGVEGLCVRLFTPLRPPFSFYQCRVAMDVAALFAAAKGSDDSKALLTAARAADAAGVARILNEAQHKKMDLDAKCTFSGCTSLHWACEKGSQDIVRMLVAAGAKINARDGQQWTPLMVAAQKGRAEIVKVLISLGADINLNAKGMSALDVAAGNEVERILIEAGKAAPEEDRPAEPSTQSSRRITRSQSAMMNAKRPRVPHATTASTSAADEGSLRRKRR